MYSNMYLYAKGATITKTSPTKHLILRLGNTKESEGGYEGYRNVIIDGGTWDFNYQRVAEKDEPGDLWDSVSDMPPMSPSKTQHS